MTTQFQRKVYELCSMIPRGKVSTYALLANKLGNRGFQAVGQALNRNPFAPKVPCHRVIASSGRVGGFAFGQEKKVELLVKEGIQIVDEKVKDLDRVLFTFD